MIDDAMFDAEEKMEKAVGVAREDMGSIRTGRANPSMFNKIHIEYYGALTPVTQVASITTPEARLVVIKPYEPSSLRDIETAIRNSDLGVNPTNDGTIIRVDSVVPTQGYHSARLIAQANGEPDDTGTVGFVLTAIPPEGAEAIGPARTRTLRAAVFVPNRAKRQVKSVRILDATGVRWAE